MRRPPAGAETQFKTSNFQIDKLVYNAEFGLWWLRLLLQLNRRKAPYSYTPPSYALKI
ncbi:MAG: hypothetical protein ACO2PN_13525 [Pyrobaculum sp.]